MPQVWGVLVCSRGNVEPLQFALSLVPGGSAYVEAN